MFSLADFVPAIIGSASQQASRVLNSLSSRHLEEKHAGCDDPKGWTWRASAPCVSERDPLSRTRAEAGVADGRLRTISSEEFFGRRLARLHAERRLPRNDSYPPPHEGRRVHEGADSI